jgi:hypothetical protein
VADGPDVADGTVANPECGPEPLWEGAQMINTLV